MWFWAFTIAEENFRLIQNKTDEKNASSHFTKNMNYNNTGRYNHDENSDDSHSGSEPENSLSEDEQNEGWSKRCVVHTTANHLSHVCNSFKEMTPVQRYYRILQAEACTQCLCIHPWVNPNGECDILIDLPHLQCANPHCRGMKIPHNPMLCMMENRKNTKTSYMTKRTDMEVYDEIEKGEISDDHNEEETDEMDVEDETPKQHSAYSSIITTNDPDWLKLN